MLREGQRMVRADDGMRGVVELATIPGFEHQELRIVYSDRGERRIAGKREKWEPETQPPRGLLLVEMEHVARAADRALRSLDLNEPAKWWEWAWDPAEAENVHDPVLVQLIVDYLQKRA